MMVMERSPSVKICSWESQENKSLFCHRGRYNQEQVKDGEAELRREIHLNPNQRTVSRITVMELEKKKMEV